MFALAYHISTNLSFIDLHSHTLDLLPVYLPNRCQIVECLAKTLSEPPSHAFHIHKHKLLFKHATYQHKRAIGLNDITMNE